MGIFDKFKSGFKKSASAFTSGLRDIVIKKEIDDKTLDKIEEYLIQSDVGVVAASEIKEIISDSKIDPKKDIAEEINTILKEYVFRQGSTKTTKLNDAYFRFQQHGELINMTHFVNLMNIASDNPKTTFACWTKRKDILNKYRKENDIPENVIMVYSNPQINKILDEPPKGFDKVFNNVWKDHAVEKQNCTGQKCMDCLRCYDKDKENVIVEAVK
mgnify:CR=1 FL=1